MSEASPQSVGSLKDCDRLDSWKQIANYMNRTVRTVQRWEAEEHLPVHRRVHGPMNRHPVHAYKSELDQWFLRNSAPPVPLAPSPRGWRPRKLPLSLAVAVVLFICACGIAAWVFSTGADAGSLAGIPQ